MAVDTSLLRPVSSRISPIFLSRNRLHPPLPLISSGEFSLDHSFPPPPPPPPPPLMDAPLAFILALVSPVLPQWSGHPSTPIASPFHYKLQVKGPNQLPCSSSGGCQLCPGLTGQRPNHHQHTASGVVHGYVPRSSGRALGRSWWMGGQANGNQLGRRD